MKKAFVPTNNYRRFIEALKRLETRGAREASMLLVSGAPGRGKSNITEGWAAQSGAIFLRANKGWTPSAFMRALAIELKIDHSGVGDTLFDRILKHLSSLGFPSIIIDEVQHCLADQASVLEKVRDFSDRTKSPIVLVAGEDGVLTKIRKYPQIASRIAENVEFDLAAPDDVAVICKTLAECEVKTDLVQLIHRDSKGVLRLVMNAISTVESVARANNLTAIGVAQFKDAGIPLCVDWQAGARRQGGAA